MFKFYEDNDKEVFIHNNKAVVFCDGKAKVINNLVSKKKYGFHSMNRKKAESISLESRCKELDILSLGEASHKELTSSEVASIYYFPIKSERLGSTCAKETYLINRKAYELLFDKMEV